MKESDTREEAAGEQRCSRRPTSSGARQVSRGTNACGWSRHCRKESAARKGFIEEDAEGGVTKTGNALHKMKDDAMESASTRKALAFHGWDVQRAITEIVNRNDAHLRPALDRADDCVLDLLRDRQLPLITYAECQCTHAWGAEQEG